MRRWRVAAALAALAASMAIPATAASAEDFAATARNIIPSGQDGGVPAPPGADQQAKMYDGLTPLFEGVDDADLNTYFKSELFGVSTDGPATVESVPTNGIQIRRDAFNVPHVKAQTYDKGIWAAGWIAAEDRGLLMEQARYNGRVAAIDAPCLSALNLVANLESFSPSEQTEAELAKQTEALRSAGAEGKKVLADIDTFLSGINAYLDAHSPSTARWTRNDIYAVNALKDQYLGVGGGDEARRSQFLGGLQERLGSRRGFSVFNDLRQFKNPESPTTIDGRFAYGHIPKRRHGSVILDPDSFKPTPAGTSAEPATDCKTVQPQASNTLMIDADHSATGDPLMVGGPQLGYFYPGLTYEIDMQAPGLRWRGATSLPFPGYLLIGRGEDFATTLTSASGDVIDEYAEDLCGHSRTRYRYRGECRTMGTFDAGTLNGDPVSFKTTVHGPVVGYARTNGELVAISRKRSSYGKDVLDQLFYRRLSNGQVHDPQSFFKAASKTPQTFNSFYIDTNHVAEYTSGKLPLRPKHVDPGLLTKGNGKYEWRGFLSSDRHPHGIDPKRGTMVNWNNSVAHGFGAADSEWGRNGSAARVDLLNHELERTKRGGEWTLAQVTAAMNAAATQDVRAIDTVPLLKRLLKHSKAPSDRARQMLDLLVAWRANGGSRLDRNLDGEIDDPGAAIMDTAWPLIANSMMAGKLGKQLDELDSLFKRFDHPASGVNSAGQYSGWYQYFDRDIRHLLGMHVKQPFRNDYCGNGHKRKCQRKMWKALNRAGKQLAAEQGTENPAAWRADATAERISFRPGVVPFTMRYTNRPSGIQQVISFDGHR